MNRLIFMIICIFASISSIHTRLSITILYESLCPDSVRFIKNQLAPTYNDIKDYVDIHFVPFGKSHSINNGEYFVCQHGPAECTGNIIQSCVLNELNSSEQAQVDYVVCQMNPHNDPTGRMCAENAGVPFYAVQECINSGLGRNIQLEAEKITKNVSPSFIPTIVYNNKFDQVLQDRSLTSFKRVVCDLIENVAPTC